MCDNLWQNRLKGKEMASFEIRKSSESKFSLSSFPINVFFGQRKLNQCIFMHHVDKKIKKKKKKKDCKDMSLS